MRNKNRRQSMKTRLRPEDVTSWVKYNQPRDELVVNGPRVHFQDDEEEKTPGSVSSTLRDELEPKYLEGGYGWVIVLYSFFFHCILDGISFSFGSVFPSVIEKYQVNRTGASVVASVFLSFPLLFAPIAGIVTDRIGFKKTLLLGSVIFLAGLVTAIFSETYSVFSFAFAGGCGFGMALLYNAALMMISGYFNENLGKATARAVMGTSVGTIACPIILEWATDKAHPLRAQLLTMLIFGCIMLIISVLVKNPRWGTKKARMLAKFEEKYRKYLQNEQQLVTPKNVPARRACSLPTISIPFVFSSNLKDGNSVQNVKETVKAMGDAPLRSKSVAIFVPSEDTKPTPEYSMIGTDFSNLEHLDLEFTNSPCTTVHRAIRRNRSRMLSKTSMSVDRLNELDDEELKISFSVNSDSEEDEDESSESSSDSEESLDGDSSSSELSDDEEEKNALIGIKGTARNNANQLQPRVPSAPSSARHERASLAPGSAGVRAGRVMAGNAGQPKFPYYSNLLSMGKTPSAPNVNSNKTSKSQRIKKRTMKFFKNLYDEHASLLKFKSFLCFTISTFFLYIILDVPYVFMIDYLTISLGFPEEFAAWLTPAIGLASFLSINAYGFIADMPYFRSKLFIINSASTSLATFSFLIGAFAQSKVAFVLASILFGIAVSANFTFQSTCLCFMFPESKQTAISFICCMEGVATLVGPAFFGYIRDKTGTYIPIFFISAFFAFVSSAFAYGVHFYWQREQEEDESEYMRSEASRTLLTGNEQKDGTLLV